MTEPTDAERRLAPGGVDGRGKNVGGDHQIDARIQQARRVADVTGMTFHVDLQEPDVDVVGRLHQGPQFGEGGRPGVVETRAPVRA